MTKHIAAELPEFKVSPHCDIEVAGGRITFQMVYKFDDQIYVDMSVSTEWMQTSVDHYPTIDPQDAVEIMLDYESPCEVAVVESFEGCELLKGQPIKLTSWQRDYIRIHLEEMRVLKFENEGE